MYSADISPHLRVEATPLAHSEAIVQGDHWRFTVLTDGLVRAEWSDDGVFEDRATTFAINRALPVPCFRVVESPGAIEIVTDRLRLRYDGKPFSPHGLTVRPLGFGAGVEDWRYGDTSHNLGGTARTLDGIDGRIPLEGGVVSRRGVAVVDDSSSFAFTDDGWIAPRDAIGEDLYIFAYAHDYTEAIRALYAVSGHQPVLPRWAFGNWWSRYHRYTADSYLELLDRFDRENVRFSVAVLDMDWHRVDSVPPEHGRGWTGYSWEPELFPDPEAFLADMHTRALRVTLNLHPADGVLAFEDAYPRMAEALGVEPDGTPIFFDPTDREFMRAYLEMLHHPLEEQGVDFWWMDWQQGSHSKLPGIDPLWVLNHIHYLDSASRGTPLLLSRYAGPGSHRYPVGFSGDTVASWESLAFQPEFTATASNIGYATWSHDIGGHWGGSRDDELTVRWSQLGVYSPILRLHSTANPFIQKEPWAFPAEAREALGDALRRRVRLVPYLHSMNHRAADHGIPLIRPLYHEHPEAPEAYERVNEFFFGSELLVAPITSPRDPVTLRGWVTTWLPDGVWIDLHTGIVVEGGRTIDLHRDLGSIPALLKAGGIVPLAAEDETDAARNPESLEIVVAAGADGEFTLVEDVDTHPGAVSRTPIRWNQASGALVIGPAEGPDGVIPPVRTWTASFPGLDADASGPGAQPNVLGVSATVTADVRTVVTVRVAPDPTPRTLDVERRLFDVLSAAQHSYADKEKAWSILRSGTSAGDVLARLQALHLPSALLSALSELLAAR